MISRILVIGLMCCLWSVPVAAKTIKVANGSVDVNQLHEELLDRFPAWHGTRQPDGSYADPLLHVEYTDEEIELTVPDGANEAAIQAVVAAHVPQPDVDEDAALRAQDPSTMSLEERVTRLEALLDLD